MNIWNFSARVSATRFHFHTVHNNSLQLSSGIHSRNRCIIPPSPYWGITDEREVDGKGGYGGAEAQEITLWGGGGWGGWWYSAQRKEHHPAHQLLIQMLHPCLLPWILDDRKQAGMASECVCVLEKCILIWWSWEQTNDNHAVYLQTHCRKYQISRKIRVNCCSL